MQQPDPKPAENVATVQVAAETARVSKRVVETGRALIQKTVSAHDQEVTALLDRSDVAIERVAIDQVVTELPVPRQEGDTWIIPVMEERLVIEKQLVLREELRIRTIKTQDQVSETVRLQQEHVDVQVTEPTTDQGGSP